MTETFGQWLSARLDERGWLQVDLVRKSGGMIRPDRVSKWLNDREVPGYPRVVLLANTLGVEQDVALEAAGYQPPTARQVRAVQEAERRGVLIDIESERLIRILQDYPDSAILDELHRRAADRENVGGWSDGGFVDAASDPVAPPAGAKRRAARRSSESENGNASDDGGASGGS